MVLRPMISIETLPSEALQLQASEQERRGFSEMMDGGVGTEVSLRRLNRWL